MSVAAWDEAGRLDTETGQMLVDVAELDDLSAAVLLAVLLGVLPGVLNGGEGLWIEAGGSALVILTKLIAFIAGCYAFAHLLGR